VSEPAATSQGRARGGLEQITFQGAGLTLAADAAGPLDGPPVLFLHGGGQTRSSWGRAVQSVAERGYRGITMDSRGHGESGWAPDGDYTLDRFVDDLEKVVGALSRPPVMVGASMGGLTALMGVGDRKIPAAGLILVDVTPRIETKGAEKIGAFMRSAPNGFADLDEAADAVAAYLPHRPRPKDVSGLKKNLRERDGRLYWHWDPAFIGDEHAPRSMTDPAALEAAAENLAVPTLLVRGGLSEVVSRESADEFLALAPHAEFVDVGGADHMVAGDANDAFNAAVLDFLRRHAPPRSTAD
jgi:pimeloyl-ACP methyl ester carboxylesterase